MCSLDSSLALQQCNLLIFRFHQHEVLLQKDPVAVATSCRFACGQFSLTWKICRLTFTIYVGLEFIGSEEVLAHLNKEKKKKIAGITHLLGHIVHRRVVLQENPVSFWNG